jgi:hypothetical protein
MANLTQLLLIIVIATLTFLVALVAIQVLHVLHEAKLSIRKFNQWLDTNPLSETPAATTEKIITAAKKIDPAHRFFRRSGSDLKNS